MRSALPSLLLATFFLLTVPASPAQTVNSKTGAVCDQRPTDMTAVRSKADTGDAAAEYELGRSMLSPRGFTDSEFLSALPWFRRSAEQGYAPAEYMYGGIFREGRWKDAKQLVYWWTKAAEQGNVHAQLWLGVFYEQGQYGLKRDYAEAIKWLSLAAKQGQPDAQVTLGQMYEDAEGVPPDYKLAAYWYRKAADHSMDLGGAGVGANSLAQLYQNGRGTPEDYVFVYLSYAHARDTGRMRSLAQKMTVTQFADAQRRVAEWEKPDIPCPLTVVSLPPIPSSTVSAK